MLAGTFDLSTLNGQSGFVIRGAVGGGGGGISSGDQSGYAVNFIGDINADGIKDIIIGAPNANLAGKNQAGVSYVVFGKVGLGSSGAFNLSSLDGNNGFVLAGLTAGDQCGHALSGLGDVNGDGVDDFILGVPQSHGKAGTSYVIFGRASAWSASLDLAALGGGHGFAINGFANGPIVDESGYSVSGADINADGIADIIIGAPSANSEVGKVYVIFGKLGLGNGNLDLTTLTSSDGFIIPGLALRDFNTGVSVSNAGDVNADGITDLIIGATNTCYVIFGRTELGNSGIFDLSTLDGSNGFVINGIIGDAQNAIGASVGSAGDVNGDGINDLIIGAQKTSPNGKTFAGASYIIFGKFGSWCSGVFNLSSLNGTNGFTLPGVSEYDASGISVHSAGDLNGDSVADFIIGAPQNANSDFHQWGLGTGYVVFGKHGLGSGTLGTFSLFNLDGANGFATPGLELIDWNGISVSGAEDVNGDGAADIIIGAPYASPSGKYQAGASYVIFGYGLPRLVTNQLTLSQGETCILTANNLKATDSVFPSDVLVFTASNIQQGFFAWINGTTFITHFSQSAIHLGQVVFIQNGSPLTPGYGYAISVSNPASVSTAPEACNISFNLAPVIKTNEIAINRGQTIILNPQALSATDVDSIEANLIFIVSGVQYGQFSVATQPSIAITTFLQSQVTAGQIQFTQDGSSNKPIYFVSVSDGKASNMGGPEMATINFNPASINTPSENNTSATSIGIAFGIVGAGVLAGITAFYFRTKAKQELEQAIVGNGSASVQQSEFRKNVFSPIAKKIYEQIKISGFLGHLGKQTAERFIVAIQTLVEELQKQGVDLDLEKMTPENQQRLLKEIIKQIRAHTIAQTGIRIAGFCNFFKAEVTPIQIEDKANTIASAVAKNINLNTPLLQTSTQAEMTEHRSSTSRLTN